jgi:hypothetical protein
MRVSAIAAATALLAAIATCALAPSPNMREMWWIPGWLGEWADRYPNFRNFPVFCAFSALIVLVVTRYQPLATRYGRWRLAFGVFVATSLLGASLEVLQLLFLPNRHFDWADIGWSASGAFAGATAGLVGLLLAGTMHFNHGLHRFHEWAQRGNEREQAGKGFTK